MTEKDFVRCLFRESINKLIMGVNWMCMHPLVSNQVSKMMINCINVASARTHLRHSSNFQRRAIIFKCFAIDSGVKVTWLPLDLISFKISIIGMSCRARKDNAKNSLSAV